MIRNKPTSEVTADLQRGCLRHMLSDEGAIDYIVTAKQRKPLWQQIVVALVFLLIVGTVLFYLGKWESSFIQQWMMQQPEWKDSIFFRVVAVTSTQPWLFFHQIFIGWGVLSFVGVIRDSFLIPKQLIAQWTACSLLPEDANQLLKMYAQPYKWRFWGWRRDLRYLQQQLMQRDLEQSLLRLNHKRQRLSLFWGMSLVVIGLLVACIDITFFERVTPKGLESKWVLGEKLFGIEAEQKDWNQVTKVEISCMSINPRYRVFFGKSKFDVFDSVYTKKNIPNLLKIHAQLKEAGVAFDYQPFPNDCVGKNILYRGKPVSPEVKAILSGK